MNKLFCTILVLGCVFFVATWAFPVLAPSVFVRKDGVSRAMDMGLQATVSIYTTQDGRVDGKRAGSGFFISPYGLIATNKHLVWDRHPSFLVITHAQEAYTAYVIAIDPFSDLAILGIKKENASFLPLGESDALQIGQAVMAIERAQDERTHVIKTGVVSGLHRRVIAEGGAFGVETIESAIETDMFIHPGDSGSPLVDMDGRVVGMYVAASYGTSSHGFALPVHVLTHAVDSMKLHGNIVRPWFGVRFIMVTPALAKTHHLGSVFGALFVRGERLLDEAIEPRSPAAKAGLVEGDIILRIDDVVLDGSTTLSSVLERHEPGDMLHVEVLHDGKQKKMDVVLGTYPGS